MAVSGPGAALPESWVILAGESSGIGLIAVVAAILGAGVLAQVFADRFQVPSVVFLIAAGLLLGPNGLGVVTQDTFGGALSTVVGVSVAIIVFEGAFHLRVEKLREAPSATLRLVTVGAAIALLGTAASVRYLLGTTWAVAFMIGALLVATGPTVITPILEVVPVRDRVAAALETEGIVNDVSAAILAVVVFEAIVTETTAPLQLAELFATRLGIGVTVGLLVAALLIYAVRYVDLSPGNAPQNARLLVLAGAVVAFGAANTLASEAGVAAVATAGLVLGNADIPYEEEILAFKGDVTLIVLSFVFISLAALLELGELRAIGLAGLAVTGLVALVIRPALVWLSTVGARYTAGERWFISLVGPRGIIPASVATLFAVELRDADLATNPLAGTNAPEVLVGTVFLVILLTVVFQGGLARQIAEYLDVIPMRVIVVGGGNVGQALAERLEDRGENVVIVEEDRSVVEDARDAGYTVHAGDGTDKEVLRSAGVENAKIAVGATGDDDVNLLVSQLVSSEFDVEDVIVRVNNPDNVEPFEDLGVRTVSSVLATAFAIDNLIERPTLSDWMNELGRSGDVQEVTVTAEDFVGMTIGEFDEMLPGGVLIALVSRDGSNQVPDETFTLQLGDRLTFVGRTDAVREATDMCHPEETPG